MKRKKKKQKRARTNSVRQGDGVNRKVALKAVGTASSSVPLLSLPTDALAALRAEMAQADWLHGAAVSSAPPLLGFVLRDDTRMNIASPRGLGFLPWVWPGTFGASLTITMYRRDIDPGMHARVVLQRSEALARRILVEARFVAVMFRDGEPQQAFDVRLPPGEAENSLATHLKNLGDAEPNPDETAHFWESCLHWKEHLPAGNRLSLSWVRSYERMVRPLAHAASDLSTMPVSIDKVPSVLRHVFEERTSDGAVKAARRLHRLIDAKGLARVVEALGELFKLDQAMTGYASGVVDLAFWTSEATEHGTRLPWWDNETNRLQYIPLDVNALQRGQAVDDYWERLLIYHPFRIDWGRVVNGSSVPCKPAQLALTLSKLVAVRDPKQEAQVDELLAGLTRQTLELPGPLTKQRIGAFVSHRAFWAGGDIGVITWTADDEFFVFVTAAGHGVQLNWFGFPMAGVEKFLDDPATHEARVREIEAALRVPFVRAAHSLTVTEKLALFEVDAWRPAPLRIELERIQTKNHPLTHWRNNSELRPSDLYVYLKSRFGDPNGMMTALRLDTSDNMFHWQYNVCVDDELLYIIGGNSGVVFRASTPRPVTRGQQWEIIKRIRASFAKHGKEMSRIRGSLEPWALLLNPYQRLLRLIGSLSKDLASETATEPAELTAEASDAERKLYIQTLKDWAVAQGRVGNLCFSIESYVPIMCEAFVNLVMFVLGRRDVKDDDVLYQSLLRQSIDHRIRALHVHCDGFDRPIDCSDARYQRYLRMRDKRNLLLHGNLDPKMMVIDRLYFDGKVPVFHDDESALHRRVRSSTSLSNPIAARESIADAQAFVDLVLAAMNPHVRDQMIAISREGELGWREDSGRIGILFGAAVGLVFDLPDGHVVPAANDQTQTDASGNDPRD